MTDIETLPRRLCALADDLQPSRDFLAAPGASPTGGRLESGAVRDGPSTPGFFPSKPTRATPPTSFQAPIPDPPAHEFGGKSAVRAAPSILHKGRAGMLILDTKGCSSATWAKCMARNSMRRKDHELAELRVAERQHVALALVPVRLRATALRERKGQVMRNV